MISVGLKQAFDYRIAQFFDWGRNIDGWTSSRNLMEKILTGSMTHPRPSILAILLEIIKGKF